MGHERSDLIPVVVGGLDATSTGFEKYIAGIGIEMRVEHTQKNNFIGDSKDRIGDRISSRTKRMDKI